MPANGKRYGKSATKKNNEKTNKAVEQMGLRAEKTSNKMARRSTQAAQNFRKENSKRR